MNRTKDIRVLLSLDIPPFTRIDDDLLYLVLMGKSNKSIEFLGNGVLGMIISQYIFRNMDTFSYLREGFLTLLTSSILQSSLTMGTKMETLGKMLKDMDIYRPIISVIISILGIYYDNLLKDNTNNEDYILDILGTWYSHIEDIDLHAINVLKERPLWKKRIPSESRFYIGKTKPSIELGEIVSIDEGKDREKNREKNREKDREKDREKEKKRPKKRQSGRSSGLKKSKIIRYKESDMEDDVDVTTLSV